ncbi:alpha/beta fold hydrolase [Salinisphaera sp. USBA-960]|nr:alpha/beta fold hydrolase [Salifodinibacter halophilus]NNC27065.1 alpha/beta fold hydrolase [Salifodinibacter halophilus]
MSDPIVIQPPAAANASVIWLHGLGASADDFVGLADELALGSGHGVRFVLPNAPTMPVTINSGTPMPAWYDIRGLDIDAPEDTDGLSASCERIDALIAAERERGIAADHIVLGGFSQGGALALYAGLCYPEQLCGVVALSAYLPRHEWLLDAARTTTNNNKPPVFMAHGDADPVLAPELGAQSRDLLLAGGYDVAWHSYPMGHEVSANELVALRDWLIATGIV